LRVVRSKLPLIYLQPTTRNPQPSTCRFLSPQGRVGTIWREVKLDERAISPSPQGRVKLSCGLCVESCAFKNALNLPLTHNPQPATRNLPFIVPSRSGRDFILRRNLAMQSGSPSPQGRVGTSTRCLRGSTVVQVAVPSRSGRDPPTVSFSPRFALSPSPQGRVVTLTSLMRCCGKLGRRPLKVGSGQ